MRLIDTETGLFVEIDNPRDHIYAILSHTWNGRGEQSYQEVREIQRSFALRGVRPLLDFLVQEEYSTESPCFFRTTPLQHRPRWWRSILNTSLRRITRPWPLLFPGTCNDHILCHKALSIKIREACAAARRHGYRLLWIDSCCIDKQSSAELSEAINSMFQWYSLASVCLAYLPDYLDSRIPLDHHIPLAERDIYRCCDRHYIDPGTRRGSLRHCKWFSRGWTLQELIAPKDVLFLCRHWRVFGSKVALADTLAEVTGIEASVLTHTKSFREVSVADRFHWTRQRKTARVEDEAYSLLGIFGIHMPIIYGEGKFALLRLQKEIMQTIPDQTLFAWPSPFVHSNYVGTRLVATLFADSKFLHARYSDDEGDRGLLTTNLENFHSFSPIGVGTDYRGRVGLSAISQMQLARRLGRQNAQFHPSYSITPFGVYMHVPLIPVTDIVEHSQEYNWHILGQKPSDTNNHNLRDIHLAILACEATGMPGSLVAIPCRVQDATDTAIRKSIQKCRTTYWTLSETQHFSSQECNTAIILSPELLARLRSRDDLEVEWTPISIPLSDNRDSTPRLLKTAWNPPRGVALLRNRAALEELRYTVSCVYSHHKFPPGRQPPNMCQFVAEVTLLTLADGPGIHVQVRWVTIRGQADGSGAYKVHIDVGTKLKAEVPFCADSDHRDTSQPLCFTPDQTRTVVTREVLVPLSDPGRTATLRIAFFLVPQGYEDWSSGFTLDLYNFSDMFPSLATAI